MYGNVNRKKNRKDGTYYRDYFYYQCKHTKTVSEIECDYSKQWGEEKIDNAVIEIISKLVHNPKFADAIKTKIDSKIDTVELETEIETKTKKIKNLYNAKNKLGMEIDRLDYSDSQYSMKYQDMQNRLNSIYDEIANLEGKLEELETRRFNVIQQKIKGENIYQILINFDKFFAKFTDIEKKIFFKAFIERVDIFPEEQPDGRFIKSIKFTFPIYIDDEEVIEIGWEKNQLDECVVLMSRTE